MHVRSFEPDVHGSKQNWILESIVKVLLWCIFFPLICVWEELVELIKYRVASFNIYSAWNSGGSLVLLLDIFAIVVLFTQHGDITATIVAVVALLPHVTVAVITAVATLVIASAEHDEDDDD